MFYKLENHLLMYGDIVSSIDYQLLEVEKDQYQYPVDGWYWFDTEAEARTFFNLPPLEEE
jgi:hypothetical protein